MHVTPEWRNSGPRYDGAMIASTEGKYYFAEIRALFRLSMPGQTNIDLALASVFYNQGRNKLTGYIDLKHNPRLDIISLQSIVRASHILPPTSTRRFHAVQDLLDGDALLRLARM